MAAHHFPMIVGHIHQEMKDSCQSAASWQMLPEFYQLKGDVINFGEEGKKGKTTRNTRMPYGPFHNEIIAPKTKGDKLIVHHFNFRRREPIHHS